MSEIASKLRPALLVLACVAGLATATAQEARLPDMGSSAGRVLSPAQQREYGTMLLSQLRHRNYTLNDPLLNQWLQGVGQRLGAASDRPDQPFTFFLLKDRQINAFATLGGYIGVNAGLILMSEREDELAGVLSHEIAHVTQTHVLRAVERAQRDQVPILLGMLAAIAAAQSSNSSSSGNAAMAAVLGAQGLMIQRQIDYTRSNESEADRLGIRTLARGGYDPKAMANMFERMQAATRANRGSEESRVPDYLMTHPVTTLRIAEAKERAGRVERAPLTHGALSVSDNPLLPAGLRLRIEQGGGASGDFAWARERLRVLSARSPREALTEYERLSRQKPLDEAGQYGLALAQLGSNQTKAARQTLSTLLDKHPGERWLQLAMAEAEARGGQTTAADERFERLRARFPADRAVAVIWARLLTERNDAEAGRRALTILRPLLGGAGDDPDFQRAFARANEIAGDNIRAGEAYAEAEFLTGNAENALLQLDTLRRRPDLDYYARTRIDARIAAITLMMERLR
ncbi:M48 family peptidase [Lysobacter pythonis]|uniref:Putative beta-barrel assembly-enhancing protease n=1 Tax=Solilutibacter pythonis TaxID=2483112 RepID=A0A3M2I7K3_9GAMM|nr:M48 family metalloprotease [Lysobacter pythonis]RMH94467.1 M48 family peptidase [Lysobacter pythonis]